DKPFTIAMPCDISGLDPTEIKNVNTVYGSFVLNLLHDKLFFKNKDGELTPGLLKQVPIKKGKFLDCELKDNIFFHNGKPMTTDDIIFTINRGKEKKNNFFSSIKEIQKIDKQKFKIELQNDELWWDFPFIESIMILNKEAVETNENEGIKIGTGAYKLKKYVRNQEIILEVFDKYHNPNIIKESPKHLKIKISIEDTTNLQELEQGTIQAIHSFSASQISTVKEKVASNKYKNIKILENPTASSSYIYFNKAKTDKLVRTIITQSLDIQKIINQLKLSDVSSLAKTYINSSIKGHDPTINHHNVQIAEAQRKVRELKDAQKNLTIASAKQTPYLNKIVEQLREVGFEVNLQVVEFVTLTSNAKKGSDSPYNFIFLGENFDMEYGHTVFDSYFLTTNNENNFCSIDDEDKPYIEDKVEIAKKATNEDKYKEIMSEIEKYLLEQHYIFPLTESKSYVLVNKNITQGFEQNQFGKFYNIKSIRMNKDK
ncbi:ABC transporter substrate-binding protein, partial [Candidatus Phytoplasma phoenicium]